MISRPWANKILKTLMIVEKKMDAPDDLYLGLCVTEPDVNGNVDSEPTSEFYSRLHVCDIEEGVNYVDNKDKPLYDKGGNTPVAYEKTEEPYKNITSFFTQSWDNETHDAIIANDRELQFKTAREGYKDDEGNLLKILWFFISDTETKGTPAIMWGKIKNSDGAEGIEVAEGTVPTFYEHELKISLDVPLEASSDS